MAAVAQPLAQCPPSIGVPPPLLARSASSSTATAAVASPHCSSGASTSSNTRSRVDTPVTPVWSLPVALPPVSTLSCPDHDIRDATAWRGSATVCHPQLLLVPGESTSHSHSGKENVAASPLIDISRARAASSSSSCTSTSSVSQQNTWNPFPLSNCATAAAALLLPTPKNPSSLRAPLQPINHELEQKEGQDLSSLLQPTSPGEFKYTANSLVQFASSQNWDQQSENLKLIDWNALHTMANAMNNGTHTPLANGLSILSPTTAVSTAHISNPQSSAPLAKLAEGDWQELKKDHNGALDLAATQKEVERILKDYVNSFTVQVVGEEDSRFLPILDAEGCPKCLRGVDDNIGPKVILRCLQQRCYHVIHVSCVMKPCPADNPEAPEGTSHWQEATLKKFHCSSYFFNRELKPDDSDLNPMPQHSPGSRRNCLMALEISHLLSNATALRVNWENALSSLMDHKTGKEYLLLSLDKLQPENGQPQAPPVFRAQRGRVVFKCTDLARNAVWHHDCNYDISKQVGGDLARLVFTDRESQNTLTLGVQKQRVPRDGAIDPSGKTTGTTGSNTDLVDAITLLYVKYEFCPQSQQSIGSPMFGPLLNVPPYASPLMNPAGATSASAQAAVAAAAAGRPGQAPSGQPGQVSPMTSPMQAAPMMTPNGHLVFPVPLSPPPIGNSQANFFSPLLSPLMSRPGGLSSNRKLSYPGGPLLPHGANYPAGFDHLSFDPSNRGGMLPLLPAAGNGHNARSSLAANGEGPDANKALQAQRQLYFDNDQRLNLLTLTQAQQSAAALLATNPNSAANSVNNTPRGSFMGALPGTPLLPSGMLSFPPPSPILTNGAFPQHGAGMEGYPYALPGQGMSNGGGAPAGMLLPPPSSSNGVNDGRRESFANSQQYGRSSGAMTNGRGGMMQPPLSPDFGAPRFNPHAAAARGGGQGAPPNGLWSHNQHPSGGGAPNSGPMLANSLLGPASGGTTGVLSAQLASLSLSSGANAGAMGSAGAAGGGALGRPPSSLAGDGRGAPYDSYAPRSRGAPGGLRNGGGPSRPGSSNAGQLPLKSGAPGGGSASTSGSRPGSSAGASNPLPLNTSIDHVIGRVYHLSKTQSGSRFVQEKLSDPQYFPIFFNELKTRVADLMMDCFGHYAIEALLGMCDREQLLILLVNLSNRITEVACHKQGSFSIQFMMDCLTTQTQIGLLADALYPDVDEVMLNCSGHYVILRFLQRYSYPYTKFIHKAIVEHTVKLATDHYGLRVLKNAVEAGPAAQMQEVFSALIKCTNTLVENQYGNYIVQHLLDVAPKPVGIQLKQKMNGKYVRFSKQKFSSNVVEKCLRNSNREWKYTIIRQLISASGELISDKYGNYCLQTALSVADRQLVHEFTQAVYPHLNSLRENIKAKWKKILESAHAKHNPGGQPIHEAAMGLVGETPFMPR